MTALTLAQANQIIASALAKSTEAGYRPICIAGVQAAGLMHG